MSDINFQELLNWVIEYVQNPVVWGAGALIIVLIIVLILLSKLQPGQIRAFGTSSGYVQISRAALVDLIKQTCEQIDVEKKPGVRIKTKRNRLNIDVRIRLSSGAKLVEVADTLQEHLKETMKNGLGITKLGNINVTVVGIKAIPLIKAKQQPVEPVENPKEEAVPVDPIPLPVNESPEKDLDKAEPSKKEDSK